MLFSCCIATGFGIRYCSSSLFQIPRKQARMKIKALLIAATRRENREDLENAPQINPKMELVCKQCNRLKINMMKIISLQSSFKATHSLMCTQLAINKYHGGHMIMIYIKISGLPLYIHIWGLNLVE